MTLTIPQFTFEGASMLTQFRGIMLCLPGSEIVKIIVYYMNGIKPTLTECIKKFISQSLDFGISLSLNFVK